MPALSQQSKDGQVTWAETASSFKCSTTSVCLSIRLLSNYQAPSQVDRWSSWVLLRGPIKRSWLRSKGRCRRSSWLSLKYQLSLMWIHQATQMTSTPSSTINFRRNHTTINHIIKITDRNLIHHSSTNLSRILTQLQIILLFNNNKIIMATRLHRHSYSGDLRTITFSSSSNSKTLCTIKRNLQSLTKLLELQATLSSTFKHMQIRPQGRQSLIFRRQIWIPRSRKGRHWWPTLTISRYTSCIRQMATRYVI